MPVPGQTIARVVWRPSLQWLGPVPQGTRYHVQTVNLSIFIVLFDDTAASPSAFNRPVPSQVIFER